MVITVYLLPSTVFAQDPTGHWRTFETAHFNVHVREEYRELGPRVAGEAEAAWSELARIVAPPSRRVELVVADNDDESNGFASVFPLPRVVIFALPPAGDIELEAYDRWLRLVLTHELAHIFHLDLAHGWWGTARTVLGRAPFLFPNEYTTPWMREGLAVFYESRLTAAGRLGGSFHRAVVRAAAEEQAGLRIDEASTATPKWPAGLRAYAFGSELMRRTAQDHGDSAIARFADALARKWIPWLQLGAAWRRATGERLGDSWRDAQDRGTAGQGDGGTGTRPPVPRSPDPPLLTQLRLVVAPRLSRNGRYLAIAQNDGRDATRLLVLRRFATAADTAPPWRFVARLNGVNGIAWMPDGRMLVSQLEFTDPYTTRADLWTYAMTGERRQLTFGQRLLEPDVSAAGAIVAVRALPGGRELVLLDEAKPSAIRTLAAAEPGVEYATPRFSADGRWVAVVRVVGGRHDIALVSVSSGEIRSVTGDSVPDLMPAFSPDGRWLAWSREVQGIAQIVGVPVHSDGSTGTPFVLSHEPYAAYVPAPANGDSLYYFAYHADGYRLQAGPLGGDDTLALAPVAVAPPPAAPTAEVRAEHGYHPLASVLPQYWIPQFYVEPAGSWIGVLTSGEDALGRHQWSASLLAGLGALNGRVADNLAYVYSGLRHVTLDVSSSQNPRLFRTTLPDSTSVIVCCDRNDETQAGVTVTHRRWRTLAQVRLGIEATADHVTSRRGFAVGAGLSHVIGPALAISPQDGWRVAASVRHRARTSGDLQSTEAVLRGAAYRSAPSRSFARQVFAVRAALGTVGGTDPVEFSVGGVSSAAVTVLPGITLGGGDRAFQVRGYPAGTLTGRRAFAASIENRVPLALVARGLGLLPAGLDRVSAALFTDLGVAWSHPHCPVLAGDSTSTQLCASGIWSVGAELAADLVLAYDFPLRVRVGSALQVTHGGRAGTWVAVGTAF